MIENKILTKIKKAKRGTLFFVDNFIQYGNTKAVSKALQRLATKGEIIRVAPGFFVRPQEDPIIGTIIPSIEEIATAIAKRDKARIVPTGIYALNKLGLTEQVPLNVVFLTNSSPRKVKIGKNIITFKKAAAKSVSTLGEISTLVIQALKTIGQTKVTPDIISKIQDHLKRENKFYLANDIKLAPEWIRKIMRPVLEQMSNE